MKTIRYNSKYPILIQNGSYHLFAWDLRGLHARTWYGFPAYARLDQGLMWPTAYAITDIDDAIESAIRSLVRCAVGKE